MTGDERRKIIYVGDSTHKVLSAIEGDRSYNRSGRINTVCERYLALVSHSMPEFTIAEWLAIMDANHDPVFKTSLHPYTNIEDYPHRVLSRRYDIDAEELTRRVAKMSLGERIAIAEAIDRFWGSAWKVTHDKHRALERIGARIKPQPEAVT